MTAHIESKKEDIASIVIMPGDPLRAKMIAEEFLSDYRLVNSTRNMLAYTGKFNGVEVTVFASGMGIPSIGIYAYELFKFYDVKKIIRVGSCGSLNENVHVKDVVLAKTATSSTNNFPKLFSGCKETCFEASTSLNDTIKEVATNNNISIKYGDIITSEVFDVYVDYNKFIKNFEEKNYMASEMEAYALFYLAKLLNKEAACLLTVVDSKYEPDVIISREDRQNALKEMINLALLSIIK